jgi:hypothetical protein
MTTRYSCAIRNSQRIGWIRDAFKAAAAGRLAQNGGFKNFCDNVATLPLDASSAFIRIVGGSAAPRPVRAGIQGFTLPPVVAPIVETLEGFRSGRIQTYVDLFATTR